MSSPHATTAVRLAHLSDMHLAPLPSFGWRHWNLKRLLGYINWHRNRQYIHTLDALQLITDHIKQRSYDHVLVGGDLINIGLPEEYANALKWLLELGSPDQVAVVPGNHDIYTRLWTDPGIARWQAYMMGNTAPRDTDKASFAPVFPYLRIVDKVAIIAVNTAHPTAPGYAQGEIGAAQMGRIKDLLAWTGERGLFRLVLMHHPPRLNLARPRRGLTDGATLSRVIADTGAELIVHGHNHRPMRNEIETPMGRAPVYGVASASAETTHGDEPLACYHELLISGSGPGSWAVTCNRFGLNVPTSIDDDITVDLQETWTTRPGAATDIETAATVKV